MGILIKKLITYYSLLITSDLVNFNVRLGARSLALKDSFGHPKGLPSVAHLRRRGGG
ncbi:hypothetical protein H1P_4330004 [Hyella patelloides LEGE 07179]|uniref:Uncharacterized protein n=1 Tax=Hyella patelloides LEGE 07179 TaxID=945734 RepID=A0A563VXY9_9CYAN|nr:hypothetical protein H1P_4330004 [Hyella patelloides LEGE 07179]